MSQKKDDNEGFSKGVLGGAFYMKYSKSNPNEEEIDLHANSMIKARLQGNILDVIKRNAKIQADRKEKPLESVIELPSRMFNTTRDAPDISLFKKPLAKQCPGPQHTFEPHMDTLLDLENTIKFVPAITSTPIGQQKCEIKNDSFSSNITPLPIQSQPPNSEKRIEIDMNEKYGKMCEIMNSQSDLINKVLFKDAPPQLSVTRMQLQGVLKCYKPETSSSSSDTYQTDEVLKSPQIEMNKTFVISSFRTSGDPLETPSTMKSDLHSREKSYQMDDLLGSPQVELNKTFVIERHRTSTDLKTPSILRSALFSRKKSIAKSNITTNSWLERDQFLTQAAPNPEKFPFFDDLTVDKESLFGSPLRTPIKRIQTDPDESVTFGKLFSENSKKSKTFSNFFTKSPKKSSIFSNFFD